MESGTSTQKKNCKGFPLKLSVGEGSHPTPSAKEKGGCEVGRRTNVGWSEMEPRWKLEMRSKLSMKMEAWPSQIQDDSSPRARANKGNAMDSSCSKIFLQGFPPENEFVARGATHRNNKCGGNGVVVELEMMLEIGSEEGKKEVGEGARRGDCCREHCGDKEGAR